MKTKLIKRFFIWSEKPFELAKWYEEMLGLRRDFELNLSDDTGVSLSAPQGGLIWIGYHDKVKGKNKDPYRFMISFIVDSVKDAYKEMTEKEVEFIVKPFLAPTKDKYCATFKNPEGNIMQLFSKKA